MVFDTLKDLELGIKEDLMRLPHFAINDIVIMSDKGFAVS
jgi:hypothetical protein